MGLSRVQSRLHVANFKHQAHPSTGAGAGDRQLESSRGVDLLQPAHTAALSGSQPPPLPLPIRSPLSANLLRRLQKVADALTIACSMFLAWSVLNEVEPLPRAEANKHLLVALVSVPVWLAALAGKRLYTARVIERAIDELRLLVAASVVGAASMVAIGFALGAPALTRTWVAWFFVAVLCGLVVQRSCARQVFHRLRASGRMGRRVVIVGTDSSAIALMHTVQRNPSLGYEVVGFIGEDERAQEFGNRGGCTVLGNIAEATSVLRLHSCVGVLVSQHSTSDRDINRLTRELTDDGFHVAISTGLNDIDVVRIRPQQLDNQLLIYVEPTIRTGWRRRAKRTFDVAIAGAGLLIVSPFIAVAAVLIKLDSPGPVLFRQQRVGRSGQTFNMIKLRTMCVDAEGRKESLALLNESDGPLFKIKRDPRITRVGRVLRSLSIDEFPQFWNVLRGDMSVVGPRPALPTEMTAWDEELLGRLRVLPGITGMWQVSGRSDASFDQYKRWDLYYVDNWTLAHDIRIVFRTFWVVLSGRGAS